MRTISIQPVLLAVADLGFCCGGSMSREFEPRPVNRTRTKDDQQSYVRVRTRTAGLPCLVSVIEMQLEFTSK